jgi:hypothetical protein
LGGNHKEVKRFTPGQQKSVELSSIARRAAATSRDAAAKIHLKNKRFIYGLAFLTALATSTPNRMLSPFLCSSSGSAALGNHHVVRDFGRSPRTGGRDRQRGSHHRRRWISFGAYSADGEPPKQHGPDVSDQKGSD